LTILLNHYSFCAKVQIGLDNINLYLRRGDGYGRRARKDHGRDGRADAESD
jgi:hypothetical protein